MAKFVDINSLTEKTLDGSESVQVSDTQKSKLVNILTQLGKNLQMAVNGYDSWQLPNFDTNSTPVQNWLNALAFACGLRDESTGWGPFRIINGNDGDIAYFVILWYDNINNLTEAFVICSYPEKVITLYEKSGKQHLTSSSDQDSAVIQDILSTGGWTKLVTINGGSEIESLAAEKVLVAAPTLFDDTSAPTVYPNDSNNLQQLIQWILYTLGVRNDANGLGRTMFIVHGNGNMGIIIQDTQNVDTYYALVFGDGQVLNSYSIESTTVAEWVSNHYSDVDILNSILENGTSFGSIPFDMSVYATRAYVKPHDVVLTTFTSGNRTVIPGENITTNLTSGTLKVQVPSLLTAQVKSGPFRDVVIDVPYGVTVQFASQPNIVYKAENVDGFTATSGRKVYTIHFVPTTSSTTNITFRAFVNVTNYK